LIVINFDLKQQEANITKRDVLIMVLKLVSVNETKPESFLVIVVRIGKLGFLLKSKMSQRLGFNVNYVVCYFFNAKQPLLTFVDTVFLSHPL